MVGSRVVRKGSLQSHERMLVVGEGIKVWTEYIG